MFENEETKVTRTYGEEYLMNILQKLIEDEFNNTLMVTTMKEW